MGQDGKGGRGGEDAHTYILGRIVDPNSRLWICSRVRALEGAGMPGGEVSWPMDGGRGVLRAVEELLVELGAAHVVA